VKKSILALVLMVSLVAPAFASNLAFDFNNDNIVNSKDIAIALAWIGLGRPTTPAQNILDAAKIMLPTITNVLADLSVPTLANADLNGDGIVNSKDIAFVLAWIGLGRPTTFATNITSAAVIMLPTIPTTATLTLMPGSTVSAGGTAVTIDIQTQE
jgi:hypothetical protein